ncbi:MAG: ATP-binding cassette domain-containing protein [Candidatus Eisenbacteria bacterium]
MNSAPVVRAHSLSKSFGSFAAVSDMSFEVAQGEVFALLGPNGAGKTTLIRMLMDITRPDSGSAELFGQRVDGSQKSRVGYLPEERGLYKRMPVGELLEYYARLKSRTPADARRLAAALLARLELSSWAKKKVSDLSKGMQQKLQFMTALIGDPELLVLDEPFSGLDPVNVRLFEDVIAERRAAGATVLLSTHQMNKVEELCDRALMIHRGRRVLYGPIRQLMREHSDDSVLVRTNADLSLAPGVASVEPENGATRVRFGPGGGPGELLARLAAQRADVEEFRHMATPLEDIFVRVVEDSGGTARVMAGESA